MKTRNTNTRLISVQPELATSVRAHVDETTDIKVPAVSPSQAPEYIYLPQM